MSKKIITISRQFGSGGHEIGLLVAESLGIKCYDKELIALAAEHGNVEYKRLYKLDEKNDGRWYKEYIYEGNENVPEYQTASNVLFSLESDVIKKIASEEDAVIIGRCADNILKDTDTKLLTVYIHSPFKNRVARKMQITHQTEAYTESNVKKIDAQRKAYYEAHAGNEWGDYAYYDLIFDSSVSTKGEIVNAIVEAFNKL